MFLNPIMLAGIGGAAVPLVLHLLSRARCRTIDWGVMMFLHAGRSEQYRSARLKQLVLLAVRMGMIVLLSLALARPVVRGAKWFGGLAGGAGNAAVIVVDCSGSMGLDENGRTRMDLARETVLQILASLHKGDRVGLVAMGRGGAGRWDLRPTTDHQAVALRVAELSAEAGEASVGAAFGTAISMLDDPELRSTGGKQIYVVCDRQARNWRQIDDKSLRSAPVAITVLLVGGMTVENVAVEGVELVSAPAIRGQSAEVEAKIRNYGTTRRDQVPVSCLLGSKEVSTATVSLAGGETGVVRLRVPFAGGGCEVLTVQIKAPGVPSDNRRQFAVEVIDPIRVLIVTGNMSIAGGPLRNEADFLQLALTPFRDPKQSAANPATVKVMPLEQWSEAELNSAQVVVVANAGHLSVPQVQTLEQWVNRGGGLWIAPGSMVRAEDYNRAFYREGAGLLPARLSAPVPPEGASGLLGIDVHHPVFRFLKGQVDPVPSATVARYFPAAVSGANRVLASYASGKPFLIEGSLGRGRVMLMTTAVDLDWTSLPMSGFYVPFVQSMVRYLAAGEMEKLNLTAGESIVAEWEGAVDEKMIDIRTPDGKSDRDNLVIAHVGNKTQVRYGRTNAAGKYVLSATTASGERVLQYAVSADSGESDLTPLTAEQWRRFREAVGFEIIDTGSGGPALMARLQAPPASVELWPVLLGTVIALGLGEMGLTRFWSAGGGAGGDRAAMPRGVA